MAKTIDSDYRGRNPGAVGVAVKGQERHFALPNNRRGLFNKDGRQSQLRCSDVSVLGRVRDFIEAALNIWDNARRCIVFLLAVLSAHRPPIAGKAAPTGALFNGP